MNENNKLAFVSYSGNIHRNWSKKVGNKVTVKNISFGGDAAKHFIAEATVLIKGMTLGSVLVVRQNGNGYRLIIPQIVLNQGYFLKPDSPLGKKISRDIEDAVYEKLKSVSMELGVI